MRLVIGVLAERFSARSGRPAGSRTRRSIMSRIGNLAIPIPGGVDVELNPGLVRVKGPKGELSQTVDRGMTFTRENGTLQVSRPSDERKYRALHGLTRTLVANMVQGVTQGYRKDLEIQG